MRKNNLMLTDDELIALNKALAVAVSSAHVHGSLDDVFVLEKLKKEVSENIYGKPVAAAKIKGVNV